MPLSEERLAELRENAHDFWDEDSIYELLVSANEAQAEVVHLRKVVNDLETWRYHTQPIIQEIADGHSTGWRMEQARALLEKL